MSFDPNTRNLPTATAKIAIATAIDSTADTSAAKIMIDRRPCSRRPRSQSPVGSRIIQKYREGCAGCGRSSNRLSIHQSAANGARRSQSHNSSPMTISSLQTRCSNIQPRPPRNPPQTPTVAYPPGASSSSSGCRRRCSSVSNRLSMALAKVWRAASARGFGPTSGRALRRCPIVLRSQGSSSSMSMG